MSRAKVKSKPRVKLANAKVKPPAQKTATDVPASRVQLFLRSRFNPIRRLTPELLSVYLDRFELGYLREMALVWDAIAKRDDKITLVKALREKAVSRFGYQIALVENLDPALEAQAQEHKKALEYFYANLVTTSAIDENQKGGVKKLVRQMMDAVGSRYSVHEIVWNPKVDGTLTAQFRWTPLWFFENTTGRLKYLPTEGEVYGQDLDEGGWMVTVGDGLMVATAIGQMFKLLPLRDWVTYCERNGMPAFLGKTNAALNSPQWQAMMDAVEALASDYAAVMNTSETIDVLDLKGSQANLPYEPLVKRMDAAIAALWRGGDLSTMSSGKGAEGHGSLRQEDEADILLEDDVEMINETLHLNVDKYVIEYLFGDDQPLAKFQIVLPPQEATAQDIAIDQYLVSSGVRLSVPDALKRYGRVEAKAGEAVLIAPPKPEAIPPLLGNVRRLGNVRPSNQGDLTSVMLKHAHQQLTQAQAKALEPLVLKLENALKVPDDQLAASVQRVIAELPALLKQMNLNPATARVLENAYTAALFDGLTSKPAKTS